MKSDYCYCPECGQNVEHKGEIIESGDPFYQCWSCKKGWVIYPIDIEEEPEDDTQW